jgi:trimeric autotransporter adhesin
VTTPSSSSSLPPDLLAREQAAQVATDEANARKAATDAGTSALTLAQTKYKSLVPDLTGVATNAVTDKSSGVAFSGLVTYSALNHAAEIIASRVSAALSEPGRTGRAAILLTTQSDLLTNDLLAKTVASGLDQLVDFADQVLAGPKPTGHLADGPATAGTLHVEIFTGATASALLGGLGTELGGGLGAAGGAAAVAGLGPIGLGAAAAAAVPSIISLFSSTTTVKDHTEDISDLATTSSVLAAVAERLDSFTVVHEDFRLAPEKSRIRETYQQLSDKRVALAFQQEHVAAAKAKADLDLARAQQKQDAAKKPQPSSGAATQHAESPPGAAAEQAGPPSGDSDLADQVAAAQEASAQAAATQALISGAITSIDAFTTAVNATAAGTRSPLALASLNELLHEGASASDTSTSASDSGFGYVLMVKGLGGQSEEYSKDRHIGFDTYTTLADASVAFMLYDVTARKVIKSGIANGVSSVHGHLGHPPTGLLGPNAEDVIDDQSADAEPGPHQPGQHQPGPPAAPSKSWWRRMF